MEKKSSKIKGESADFIVVDDFPEKPPAEEFLPGVTYEPVMDPIKISKLFLKALVWVGAISFVLMGLGI